MPPTRGRLSLLDELCFGASLLALSFWIAIAPGFFGPITWGLDDAGMFLRYAENLADGFGITWNRGDLPTYGLTSPLYFAWIVFLREVVGVPDRIILVGSSWLFGLFAVILLACLTRQYCRTNFGGLLSRIAPAQAPPATNTMLLVAMVSCTFSFHPFVRQIAFNGMESTLALCTNIALALSLLYFVSSPSTPRGIWGAVAGYVSFSARPELGIYCVVAPLSASLILISPHAKLRPLFAWYGTFLMLLCADSALKWLYFGDMLPLPFYVKQFGLSSALLASEFWETKSFLLDFLNIAFPYFATLLFVVNRRSLPGVVAWLLPVALHLLYLSSVSQVMGYFGRLYLPALPFLLCAMLHAVRLREQSFIDAKHWRTSLQQILPRLTLCISLTIPFYFLWRPAPSENSPSTSWGTAILGMHRLMSAHSKEFSVALTEHGFLGAQFPAIRMVDLTGLHNPMLSRRRNMSNSSSVTAVVNKKILSEFAGGQTSVDSATHSKNQKTLNPPWFALMKSEDLRLIDELLSKELPDVIWLPPPDYHRLRSVLLATPTLIESYCLLPSALQWGVAVHRGSPDRELIVKALSQKDTSIDEFEMPSECL